jgi:hypothetical protein
VIEALLGRSGIGHDVSQAAQKLTRPADGIGGADLHYSAAFGGWCLTTSAATA